MNHGSELKILWDTFRSQIAELWFPYDCRIANDRRQSQTIAEDRTWFYLLQSSAIVCDHDRRIAGDRRSVFPYDRRRSQNFLRSAICDHMETSLKQRRRRRQGRRLEKNEFIFYRRISHMPRSVQYVYRSQNLLKLNVQCQRTIPKENKKNKPPSLTFSKIPRTWSFHDVVLQRTAKKCTKNYNARAQLLFCSLNLLFCGVLVAVAVAVVVCLRSLSSSFPQTNYLASNEHRNRVEAS